MGLINHRASHGTFWITVLTEVVPVEELSRPVLSSEQCPSVPPSEMEAAVTVTAERDSPHAGVSGARGAPVLHQRGGPVERYQLRERLDDTCCRGGLTGRAVLPWNSHGSRGIKGKELARNPGQERRSVFSAPWLDHDVIVTA